MAARAVATEDYKIIIQPFSVHTFTSTPKLLEPQVLGIDNYFSATVERLNERQFRISNVSVARDPKQPYHSSVTYSPPINIAMGEEVIVGSLFKIEVKRYIHVPGGEECSIL